MIDMYKKVRANSRGIAKILKFMENFKKGNEHDESEANKEQLLSKKTLMMAKNDSKINQAVVPVKRRLSWPNAIPSASMITSKKRRFSLSS